MLFNSQQFRQRKLSSDDQKSMVIQSVELSESNPDSRGLRKNVRVTRPLVGIDALCPIFHEQMSITSLVGSGVALTSSSQAFGSLNRDLEVSSQALDYLNIINESGQLLTTPEPDGEPT